MAFQLFPEQPPVSLTPLIPLQAALKTDTEPRERIPGSYIYSWGLASRLPQGGASPALENPHPLFEKHSQRFYLAPGAMPSRRSPEEIPTPTAIFLSQNHVTAVRTGTSPWLLVRWDRGHTSRPSTGKGRPHREVLTETVVERENPGTR